ncbi:MAG: NAD(P)-binding protein [Nitrospira sp.]|nr:NAD(P)-binding protein [Nitrospira sp.]
MGNKKKVVVLGAGVGGLAAGYFLARTGKYQVTILEQASTMGGMCASFEHGGFVLDHGAHKLYSVIPDILDEIQTLMGDRLIKLPKKNRLYLRGHLVDYPLRLGNLARVLGPVIFLQLGLGYGATVARGLFDKHLPRSYEEYIVKRFGRPAYELVFEPLADKVWGNPSELHPEMARTRVPASGGMEVILNLLHVKKETAETNAEFFYYPRRGFGELPQTLKERIEAMGGEVLVSVEINKLEQADRKVIAVQATVRDKQPQDSRSQQSAQSAESADYNGQKISFPCDYLVSSIPLPVLGRLVFSDTDPEFSRSVDGLQFRHLILVYLFIRRSLVLEDQWLFFPERQFVFSRIFEQKQMNPELGPKDQTAICCDFTCTEDNWQWKATDEELVAKCVEGLVAGKFIKPDEVTGFLVKRRRNFYPRYDLQYAEKMQTVSRKLQQVENLLLTGRIGMYNYNNSDHCMDMGRFIAQNLADGQSPKDVWNALERRVRDYKIVD